MADIPYPSPASMCLYALSNENPGNLKEGTKLTFIRLLFYRSMRVKENLNIIKVERTTTTTFIWSDVIVKKIDVNKWNFISKSRTPCLQTDIFYFYLFILFQQNDGHKWPLTQIARQSTFLWNSSNFSEAALM